MSYDEHLISQAGGDGTAKRVQLTIVTHDDIKDVQFTNVDMADVKRAIDILNGDTAPASRTKDFTERDLFAVIINPYTEPEKGYECWECGAAVINTTQHTTWHNKLLP